MDFQSIDFKQLTNARNNVCRRYSCMPVSAYRFFFDCCLAKQAKKRLIATGQDVSYLMEFGLTLARSISPFDDMAMCRL